MAAFFFKWYPLAVELQKSSNVLRYHQANVNLIPNVLFEAEIASEPPPRKTPAVFLSGKGLLLMIY